MPTTQKQQKLYSSNHIRTGDTLLVKNNSGLLSRLIGFLTHSPFVHAAIAVRIDKHLYVVECKFSISNSYQLMPIDWWLARNTENQLFIGKMPTSNKGVKTRQQLRDTIMRSSESLRPYKISWLAAIYFLQILLGRSRPQFKRFFNKRKPLICSTLVQEAWERAGVIPVGAYMTPGDIVNLLGGESALIPVFEQTFGQRNIPLEASNDPNTIAQQTAGQLVHA